MQTKALPLVISLLMHISIVIVLCTARYGEQGMIAVDLVSGDKAVSIKLEGKTVHSARNGKVAREAGMLETAEAKGLKNVVPVQRKDVTDASLNELIQKGEGEKYKQPPLNEASGHPGQQDAERERSAITMALSSSGTEKRGSNGYRKDNGNTREARRGLTKENIVEGGFGSAHGPFFSSMARPVYPKLARKLGKEGRVVLRLFINEQGRLLNVEVIEKAGFGFDEAAIEAVKASTYKPAALNDVPVASRSLLPVRFVLDGN